MAVPHSFTRNVQRIHVFMLLKTTGFIVGWEWKEDFREVIYNTCDVHIL